MTVLPVEGIGEVRAGDDLAGVLGRALAAGPGLQGGDVVVVTSKIISKALGLTAAVTDRSGKERVVAGESLRVVAERSTATGVTRIVESAAGPVMAAAGVDASNTGDEDVLLLLPHDADAIARSLLEALSARLAVDPIAVIISDTAGRPWRGGQTDFALGCAGMSVYDDLRGGVDADGRPLAVTVRAVADEFAAAADLVKGKVTGIPVAVVRGASWRPAAPGEPGARSLVRTGPGDWFATGHVEAVRAALGVAPGTERSDAVGIPPLGPQPLAERVQRAVRLALSAAAPGEQGAPCGDDTITLSAPDPFSLGSLLARLEVALAADGLRVADRSAVHHDEPGAGTDAGAGFAGAELTVRVSERDGQPPARSDAATGR